MADVREFWLVNSKGVKYSLHRLNVFLNTPSGLGYSVDTDIINLGNSAFIASENYNLGSAEGEVIFLGSRKAVYQEYFDFTNFLYFRPITLHYKTPNTNESYFCQVRVISLEKGEIGQDGILRCSIQMYRQTLWYNDQQHVLEARNVSVEGKVYPLYRPYHYGAISTQNIEIYNAGVADAPLLVEVEGRSSDTMFNIFDEDNVRYGAAKILGTYDYIKIDSDDLNESIELVRDGSVIPNAINYQDLTVGDPRKVYVTFLKLKPGISKITFNFGSGEFNGLVRLTWRNAYVTV